MPPKGSSQVPDGPCGNCKCLRNAQGVFICTKDCTGGAAYPVYTPGCRARGSDDDMIAQVEGCNVFPKGKADGQELPNLELARTFGVGGTMGGRFLSCSQAPRAYLGPRHLSETDAPRLRRGRTHVSH